MKKSILIGTGVLLLLLGSILPAFAQEGRRGANAKSSKREQPARPERTQQPPSRQPPQARGQQEQRRQRQAQPERLRQQPRQQQANRPPWQAPRGSDLKRRSLWQQHRARDWRSEHRNWQQRGGYSGYHIPERHFRSHFGPEYLFRIDSYPVMLVGGRLHFQNGGFGFSVMDPWPEYWADNWYENDDVFVDYSEDGYYLYNRRYPEDRIAITVNLNW